MKKEKKNHIVQLIAFAISLFSLFEVIFGFLPFDEFSENNARIFFMGITLIGFFFDVVSILFDRFESKNDLNSIINSGLILSQDGRIPDSRILEIENDLDHFFNCTNASYHIIVISSCVDTNENPYMKTIWNNINGNTQYLYVTPATDQEFINEIITLFSTNKFDDLTNVYQNVIEKVSHYSEPQLFRILPHDFDFCVYLKDSNNQLSTSGAKGYYSMLSMKDQEDRIVSYYYPMPEELVMRICKKYSKLFSEERIIQSYISKKIVKKTSKIHGKGLFCRVGKTIKSGEIVIIKGGHELRRDELCSDGVIDSYLPIDDDMFLGAKTKSEKELVKLYINHSCDPNVGILGDRTFVAIRDISQGEELTMDYAFVDNEDYEFECNCKSRNCRHKITGRDWKIPALQRKHRKYFSEYLQKKM